MAAEESGKAIPSIDAEAIYLFTGTQLEATLLEAAGMLSTVMMPAEKVMPADDIGLALSVGMLDNDGLAEAETRAKMLRDLLGRKAPDLGDGAIVSDNERVGTPVPTQPQFVVDDAVVVEGHHAHTLPPILDGVELPLKGRVVETSPEEPELLWVSVTIPAAEGREVQHGQRIRLHVEQIERDIPPGYEQVVEEAEAQAEPDGAA